MRKVLNIWSTDCITTNHSNLSSGKISFFMQLNIKLRLLFKKLICLIFWIQHTIFSRLSRWLGCLHFFSTSFLRQLYRLTFFSLDLLLRLHRIPEFPQRLCAAFSLLDFLSAFSHILELTRKMHLENLSVSIIFFLGRKALPRYSKNFQRKLCRNFFSLRKVNAFTCYLFV